MHADAFKEKFLFCETLSETTKTADVFGMVRSFFAKGNFILFAEMGSCDAWFCHFIENVVTHCFYKDMHWQ
jgi:hypothetical protein